MQYIRKIFYLDLYEGKNKIRNCGYVKMESMQSKTYFYFYLSHLPDADYNEVTAKLTLQKEEMVLQPIKIKNHAICEVVMLSQKIEEQKIKCIDIMLNPKQYVAYHRKPSDEKYLHVNEKKENNSLDIAEEKDTYLGESKWEQLTNMFPVVSIFGKDTETLVLNPGDLVILPEEYHYLATNSFLLHGYYNYRQLLLVRWQNEDLYQYYIGVPGTYHEREKSVARMFGFEGFENGESSRGDVQATDKRDEEKICLGCFGYYMKKVSL